MRRVMLLTLLAVALPTAALANSITIDFGVAPNGGTPTFIGTTLATATSVNLGREPYTVQEIHPDDQSGLSLGSRVSLTPTTFNIAGIPDGGTGTVDFTKSWVAMGRTFTETFTSFTLSRSPHTHSLTIALDGTLSVPGLVQNEPVTAVIAFSNAGGFGHTMNWSMTEHSTAAVIPEPGTLGLLGTGVIGFAGMVRRKLKLGL